MGCWNSKLERIRPRLHCNAIAATAVDGVCTACSGSSCGSPKREAVVDTRLLGKPVAFDGRETSWRSVKFLFVAHCGATDSRLQDLLVLGESRGRVSNNIHTDPDTRALSAQLYQEDAPKLLEHAGDTEGGVAWRRPMGEYGHGSQDGSVPCCRNCFTTGSSVTLALGAARCQERTSARA